MPKESEKIGRGKVAAWLILGGARSSSETLGFWVERRQDVQLYQNMNCNKSSMCVELDLTFLVL